MKLLNGLVASSVVSLMLSGAISGTAMANDLEQRIKRLEQQAQTQQQLQMYNRLQQMQQEIQSLRGMVEEQAFELESLKKRQRDLYGDLDRRLLKLERQQGPAVTNLTAPTQLANPTTSATNTTVAKQPPVANSGVVVREVPSTATTKQPQTAALKTVESDPNKLLAEQNAYQAAFDQLRALHYDKAALGFSDFLSKYPNGRYAHIAQYWLAEAYYAQHQFKPAIQSYQALLDNHAKSPKRAEAMLKIAYSQYELGDKVSAKASLEKLLASYPNTTEASQAKRFISRM